MINSKDHPVEWAMLLYELDDARDHLESLLKEMVASGSIEDEGFHIQLRHIYEHLNRAWHSRNFVGEMPNERYEEFSRLPNDLKL
ncbi:MAG: hypothetical protein AMXMBFR84_14750 [Candidatus Hydrogenedentota bacterium]